MKYKKIIIVYLLLVPFISFTQNNQLVFAKTYGYIKYFYPSDEATQIDWNQFAIYGVGKTSSCKTQKELIDSLKKIFNPIAPLLMIKNEPILETITIKEDEEMVMWLHNGDGIDQNSTLNPYKSQYSSKRISSKDDSEIFKKKSIKHNYQITRQLLDSIYISFPLKLNLVDGKTVPATELKELKKLQDEIKISSQEFVKETDLIVAWNALKHFYPYQTTLKLNWDSILLESIHSKTSKPYTSLDILLENVSDGHAIRYKPELLEMFRLPFVVKEIDNQIVVNCSFHSEIHQGDIILKIDDSDINNEMHYAKSFISGSQQKKSFWFPYSLSLDTVPSKAKIKLIRNSEIQYHDVERIKYEYNFGCRSKLKSNPIIKIEDDIYLIDMMRAVYDNLLDSLDKLSKAKGVIFDLRGYPARNNNKILQYIKACKKTKRKTFLLPQIILPNYKNVTYKKAGWNYCKKKPQIKGRIVFLTNNSAISQSESILAYVKGTKNTTIIGSSTAGANGDIYDIALPSGEIIMFSGLIATDVNGKMYHNKGIQPDIQVEPSIKDIKNNEDALLKKAIDYINQ